MIIAHCILDFLGSSDPSASASQVARTSGVPYHAGLFFFIFVEMVPYYVAQAGLELLGLSNTPTSASRVATKGNAIMLGYFSIFSQKRD